MRTRQLEYFGTRVSFSLKVKNKQIKNHVCKIKKYDVKHKQSRHFMLLSQTILVDGSTKFDKYKQTIYLFKPWSEFQ